MTTPTDPDRSTSTDQPNEDTDSKNPPLDDSPKHNNSAHDDVDTGAISDPANRGADYYNRIINLENFSSAYILDGPILVVNCEGELQNIDEFKTALYKLYKSAYHSELAAADFRPKAFFHLATNGVSDDLKHTLQKKLIEERPGLYEPTSSNPTRNMIAKTFSDAAALGCKHRDKPGRRARTKDTVLDSTLPDTVHNQPESG